MFDLDHWREIKVALGANKLRTGLTAFGVFWGIFLLLVMLASGNGLANGVLAGFGGGATNSFFLWSQRTALPYKGLPSGREVQLTGDDLAAIRREVPEVAVLAPRNQMGGFRGGTSVVRGDKSGSFSVLGDTPQIRVIQSYKVTAGRFLNELDLAERRKVCVLGQRPLEVLFEKGESPIGQSISINGVYFQVIGVFKPFQTGPQSERDAQTIFVPFTTFQRAFNFGDRVGWIAATSRDGVPAAEVEKKVIALLKSRHQVAPEDRRAFGSFNLQEEFDKLQGLFTGISVLVWIVGIGTLAAGAIGVSNIMLIVVKERTKEIGLRRAIGARPAAIMGQIVLEAVILTTVAGYAGLVAGVGVMEGVNALLGAVGGDGPTMFKDPGVELTDALQALGILIAAGTLAGFIPARQAIRVSPMMALRAE